MSQNWEKKLWRQRKRCEHISIESGVQWRHSISTLLPQKATKAKKDQKNKKKSSDSDDSNNIVTFVSYIRQWPTLRNRNKESEFTRKRNENSFLFRKGRNIVRWNDEKTIYVWFAWNTRKIRRKNDWNEMETADEQKKSRCSWRHFGKKDDIIHTRITHERKRKNLNQKNEKGERNGQREKAITKNKQWSWRGRKTRTRKTTQTNEN